MGASIITSAQTTFQRAVGGTSDDVGKSIVETNNGFVIGGNTNSFGVSSDEMYMLRFDNNGDTLWSGTFGSSSQETAFDIVNLHDTAYSIYGFTTGYGATMGDGIFYQIDSSGTGNSRGRLGGGFTEYNRSVSHTQDGNLIVAGYTNSVGVGSNDFHITKTDYNGNIIWSKTHGGTALEYGYSVDTASGGGYYVSGATYSYGSGGQDFYLLKLDAVGDTLWTRILGASGNDYGATICATMDGGVVLGGYTENFGAGYHDPVLIKFDASGNMEWSKLYSGIDREEVSHVLQTSDGGYLLSGYSETWGNGGRDAMLIKTDALGDTLWTRVYGGTGDEEAYMTIEMTDGGFVFTGFTESFGASGKDVYIVKVDPVSGWTSEGCYQGSTSMTINNFAPNIFMNGLNSSGLISALGGVTFTSRNPDACNPCVVLTADFSSSVTLFTADFTDLTGAGPSATYLWDFGDGNISTSQNPSHTYATDSIYEVCLTVTEGCTIDSICVFVTVGCAAPLVEFSHTDSLSTYFNFLIDAVGATSYSWSFGDGGTSTDMNPSYAFTAPGTYQVCVTAYNVCDSTIYCDSIIACPIPSAGFTYTADDLDVDFTNTSFAGVDYSWDFDDGFFSIASDPSHTFTTNGTYNVCLVVTNTCGSDTMCTMISVVIGIKELENELHLLVVPNPSNGQFQIQFDGDFESLHVFDLMGREINTSYEIHANTTNVVLEGAARGTYFLQLSTSKGIGSSMIVVR